MICFHLPRPDPRRWLEDFSGRMEDLRHQGTAAPRAAAVLADAFKLAGPLLEPLRQALAERFGFPA